MYKIIRDEFSNSENTIHRISTNTFITAFSGSAGWRQFIEDIHSYIKGEHFTVEVEAATDV